MCKNGAFHLRGNLYVHYKSLDSAVMAYHAMNGRYFAGKQVFMILFGLNCYVLFGKFDQFGHIYGA